MRLATGLLVFTACGAFGQPADAPAFEVASVKVNSATGEGKGREVITPSPSGVTMKNVHLKSVVAWSYHLQPIQVSGPAWLDNDSYDIVAKATGEVRSERLRLMMQNLLAERFKLTSHRDTKEMLAYVVTVAKGGHKLKESQGEGEFEVKPNGRMGATFYHTSLARLTEIMGSQLQGVVVDETGLKGTYDFTLDISGFLAGDFHPTSMEDVIAILVQAANDQLGIKIDQKKTPAERLIIDHIERIPVEN